MLPMLPMLHGMYADKFHTCWEKGAKPPPPHPPPPHEVNFFICPLKFLILQKILLLVSLIK